MLRPCLDCGNPSDDTRCPEHRVQAERAKAARRPGRRTAAETRRRRAAVHWHVSLNGWNCPGDAATGHPPHPSGDLTAHHADAVGAGGTETGPLRVICRSANSSIGART